MKIRRRRSSGNGSAARPRRSPGASARARRAPRAPARFSARLPLAAEPVDRAVAGDPRDPGAGVVGDAVARPALERDREGVLNRVLGEVEVAEDADQGGDRPPRLAPEQAVDVELRLVYEATSLARARRSRRSVVVHDRAHLDGAARHRDPARPTRAPRRGRRPRSGRSRRAAPSSPRKGPSVVIGSSASRIVVAVALGDSPSPAMNASDVTQGCGVVVPGLHRRGRVLGAGVAPVPLLA